MSQLLSIASISHGDIYGAVIMGILLVGLAFTIISAVRGK